MPKRFFDKPKRDPDESSKPTPPDRPPKALEPAEHLQPLQPAPAPTPADAAWTCKVDGNAVVGIQCGVCGNSRT